MNQNHFTKNFKKSLLLIVSMVLIGLLLGCTTTAPAKSSPDTQNTEVVENVEEIVSDEDEQDAPSMDSTPKGNEVDIYEVFSWKNERLDMSFEHVAPGKYSEVYAVITVAQPGVEYTLELLGPSIEPPTTQKVLADENGVVHATWRIYEYGIYTVQTFMANNDVVSATDSVVVE